MQLTTTLLKFENDLSDTIKLFGMDLSAAHEHFDEGLTWRDRFTCTLGEKTLTRDFEMQGHFADELEYIRLRKRFCKQGLYETLKELTGYRPPWGALTGIRPTRLVYEAMAQGLSLDAALLHTQHAFDVSKEKIEILGRIIRAQEPIYDRSDDSVSIYVGIPFCPTRCSYCSFAATDLKTGKKWTAAYVQALKKEILAGAQDMRALGRKVRSIYLGGGTPTALSADQLKAILDTTLEAFGTPPELTVEAGRPDSIDADKLRVIRSAGASRISINPQSMNDKTLLAIGRSHSAQAIFEAFDLARAHGFDNINADIISALPGEDLSDFNRTLNEIAKLDPESLTVHTLAIKRASALKLGGYQQVGADTAQEMVEHACEFALNQGYTPYYLYRQKYMAGNLENVGYCKESKACIYNIDVMEETTSNLAFGAGAISKWVFDGRRRIERAANLKNIELYIARIDEMIEKKRELYLGGLK